MAKRNWSKNKERLDVYQAVTDKIIAHLGEAKASGKKGIAMPWTRAGQPVNAATGKPYTRINRLILMLAMGQFGEASHDPRFCTFKQAKERGWHVKEGARGVRLAFYKPYLKSKAEAQSANDDGDAMDQAERQLNKENVVYLLRPFTVFHASQIEGIPAHPATERKWEDAVEDVDRIIRGLESQGMTFAVGGNKAGYSSERDHMQMPPAAAFEEKAAYYAVLLHEAGHATGHEKRLARPFGKAHGDEEYAKEELVAEIASAMSCSMIGIDYGVGHHAEYIDEWLEILSNDKRFIFQAALEAQKATDYLLRLAPRPEYQLGEETAVDEVFDLASMEVAPEDEVFDLNDIVAEALEPASLDQAEERLAARSSPRMRA